MESEYLNGLLTLAVVVGGIGLILLVLHALYRICLACRHCCCRKCCCTCVERLTKDRVGRMRGLFLFTLLGATASVLSYQAAEVELQRGVKNVADSIDTLGDLLERLKDITTSMLEDTGKITQAASTIDCGQDEDLSEFFEEVSYVNETTASVADIFDDMIDPVDDAEKVVRKHGKRWVELIVPLAVAAPFALYVFVAGCGLGISKATQAPRTASCCLNTGAIWSGSIGIPVALVVFVVLFILSIVLSDFCFLGPAAVLTADNDNNQYIAYYVKCEGTNPLEVDVSSMDDAVDELSAYSEELEATGACTGVEAAFADIDEALESLQDSVTEITNEVLSCESIQPIVEDLFYDGICDNTVEGLYRMWVVLAACGFTTYAGLLLMPFTTAALHQQGGDTQLADDDGGHYDAANNIELAGFKDGAKVVDDVAEPRAEPPITRGGAEDFPSKDATVVTNPADDGAMTFAFCGPVACCEARGEAVEQGDVAPLEIVNVAPPPGGTAI